MHLEDALIDTIVAKPVNKCYETDLNSAIKYTRWLFEVLGVWPMVSNDASRTRQYLSIVLIIMCNGAMAFTLIPSTVHMIIRDQSFMARLMMIGPVGSCFTSMLKFVFIVSRCKMIKRCMKHMETDWMMVESVNERAIMMRNAKLGRGLTVTCAAFMYAGGLCYDLIMPILKGSKINEFNETIRPIVYPGYDIFVKVQESPTYEFVFCGTLLSAFVRYTISVAACSLAAVFVTHACGQLQIVMSRLENLFDDIDDERDSDKLRDRISIIIQCHVRGLRLSSGIEAIMRQICLIEMVASSIIICLLEYYCMMTWSNSETLALITYFILLTSRTFNILIFCQIGEIFQEQEVGTVTYMIDWYKLPSKTGIQLVMVIAMANYPRKLTAGQMMDLSVATFGAIMKTTFVYLNMLRAVAG